MVIKLTDYHIEIPEELTELIPGFIERRILELETLKECFINEDYPEISRIGHCLKGHGAGYGFEALTKIGKLLEEEAKASNKTKVSELLENLSQVVMELQGFDLQNHYKASS